MVVNSIHVLYIMFLFLALAISLLVQALPLHCVERSISLQLAARHV
jgi:hypothetical protein